MKDLVETVISQVMRQQPRFSGAATSGPSTSRHVHRVPADKALHTRELIQSQVANGATPPASDRLWQASRQFETLFVEQMMASMRKTVPDSGFLKKGFAEDVQSSMLDQAIAEAIGKQGRMGIARNMYRQLSQQTQAGTVHADNKINGQLQMTHSPHTEGGEHAY